MKTIAGIVFLLLLLCNMLGLSIAVLCLETEFEVASPVAVAGEIRVIKSHLPSVPYANTWENTSVHEGLYRIDDQLYNVVRQVHENDTLYVTLQMNSSAWHRFSELSDMMQEVNSDKKASSPIGRTIKLLNQMLKVYLPVAAATYESDQDYEALPARTRYADLQYRLISAIAKRHSPPPETV